MSKKVAISFAVGIICLSCIILYVVNHVKPTIAKTEPTKESKQVSKEDEEKSDEALKAIQIKLLNESINGELQEINKDWDIILQSISDFNNSKVEFLKHATDTTLVYMDIQKKWKEIGNKCSTYSDVSNGYIDAGNAQLKAINAFHDWEKVVHDEKDELIVKSKLDEAMEKYNQSKKLLDDIAKTLQDNEKEYFTKKES